MPPALGSQTIGRFAFISGLGFGGATTLLCNLTAELSRRQIPVMVASLERENPFATHFEAHGVPTSLQDQRTKIFEDRLAITLDTVAAFHPSAVIACLGETSYEVLRYVPPGAKRVAMVQADHAIFYDAIIPYAGLIDVAIGVSERICHTLAALPEFAGKSIHCLTSGVALPEQIVTREFPPEQPLRILYLGRLEQGQKRVHLFPHILNRLIQSEIPFIWTIAGEGKELGMLQREMKTSRADQQIRFAGHVNYQDVPALMVEHDVFLLASDAEGLPMSLMEAMSHGMIPVVSDLPSGIRQAIEPRNGIMVPPENVAGYADAILWLHGNRDEMRKMATYSQEKIRREFSVIAMTDKWVSVLTSSTQPQWSQGWLIRAPLRAAHPLYFTPALRPLRRIVLRWTSRWGAQ